MLMRRERGLLLVVDFQERLLPAIPDGEGALARGAFLVAIARRLGVPILVTEQYPQGIGHTVAAIGEALPDDARVFEKRAFGALGEPAIAAALEDLRREGRDQVILCGTEAHVCVLQTALGLRERGFAVFVASDAVASRAARDLHPATARLLHAGCHWVSAEMVAFEWMGRSDIPEFKDVLALIK